MAEIHKVRRPMFSISVHDTHVEVMDRRGCFGLFVPKNTTIPIRNIASVDVSRMTEVLSIHTIDGKEHKFRMGGLGGAAKGVRDAIFQAMK
jgi:hypothetical protein